MDLDFLLTLIEDHRHFGTLNIDDLAGFTLVLGFSNTYKIARLEVFSYHSDINL